MRYELLGPLRLLHDGIEVPLPPPQQRRLLALFLIHPETVLSVDRILEELWGDELPTGGKRTLRFHVSELRRILGAGSGLDFKSVLETTPGGYVLHTQGSEVDWQEADQLVQHVSAADLTAETQLTTMQRTLGLWRGEGLDEFRYDVFAQAAVRRFDELRLAATEFKIGAQMALGQHSATIPELQQLCLQYPYREQLQALLMTALYRSGRQTEALRAFRTARESLGEDVGLEPSPMLADLEQRILEHAPDLQEDRPSRSRDEAQTVAWLGISRPGSGTPDEQKDLDRAVRRLISDAGGEVRELTPVGVVAWFSKISAALKAGLQTSDELQVGTAIWSISSGASGDTQARRTASKRAANLASASAPGQLLVGEDVVADADLSALDAVVIERGSYRLEGFQRATPIFEVVASGREPGPPPRLLAETRVHNLPSHGDRFVGRELELRELGIRAASNRVVTITGPGGIGKTSFAIQACSGLVGRARDGVWFVDLAAVEHDQDVPAAVAEALALPTESATTAKSVAESLRAWDALILLDNCEHVTAGAAALLDALCSECPELHIVATSRQPLGIPGETVHRLTGLTTEASQPGASEAAALFRVRSALVRGPPTKPTELRQIDQIVGRLEGIPLAIEIAAGRTAYMGLREIGAQLDDEMRLLSAGDPALLPRHQTLGACMEWSYMLLEVRERTAFRVLSAFRGGWTLEAAGTVFNGTPGLSTEDPAELIDTLHTKSLIVFDPSVGEGRYRMLEPVRLYATTASDPDEVARTLALIARWLVDLARIAEPHFYSEEEALWRARLDAENDNIRESMRHALDTGHEDLVLEFSAPLKDYLVGRDLLTTEAATWLDEALASGVQVSETDRVRSLLTAANLHWNAGRLATAEAYSSRAADSANKLRSPTLEMRSRNVLGMVLIAEQKNAAAAANLDRALQIARAEGNAQAVAVIAAYYASVSPPDQQGPLLEEARELIGRVGHLSGIAFADHQSGFFHLGRGRLDRAVELLTNARHEWQGLENHHAEAEALWALADIAAVHRDPDQTRDLLLSADELARESKWLRGTLIAAYRRVRWGTADASISLLRTQLPAADAEDPLLGARMRRILAEQAEAGLEGELVLELVHSSLEQWQAADRIDGVGADLALLATVDEKHASATTCRALEAVLEARQRPVILDGLLYPDVLDASAMVQALSHCAAAIADSNAPAADILSTAATSLWKEIGAGDPIECDADAPPTQGRVRDIDEAIRQALALL